MRSMAPQVRFRDPLEAPTSRCNTRRNAGHGRTRCHPCDHPRQRETAGDGHRRSVGAAIRDGQSAPAAILGALAGSVNGSPAATTAGGARARARAHGRLAREPAHETSAGLRERMADFEFTLQPADGPERDTLAITLIPARMRRLVRACPCRQARIRRDVIGVSSTSGAGVGGAWGLRARWRSSGCPLRSSRSGPKDASNRCIVPRPAGLSWTHNAGRGARSALWGPAPVPREEIHHGNV